MPIYYCKLSKKYSSRDAIPLGSEYVVCCPGWGAEPVVPGLGGSEPAALRRPVRRPPAGPLHLAHTAGRTKQPQG